MILRNSARVVFLTLTTLSIILMGMSCSSNSSTTVSEPTQNVTPVTSTITQTTTSTVTLTQPSISTTTVTETPGTTYTTVTATATTTVTVPASTTTTAVSGGSGWTVVPTTTATPLPPTVSIPTNKTLLFTDKMALPVYDESAYQQEASTIKFLPFTDNGVYISTTFSLNPDVHLYLDIQSDSPLDSSGLGIPFDSSGGQGSKVLVNKISSGNYGSLTDNFNPSWIYAYQQTTSGSTWETRIVINSADSGTYALYFINTSGKTNAITYWAYTW